MIFSGNLKKKLRYPDFDAMQPRTAMCVGATAYTLKTDLHTHRIQGIRELNELSLPCMAVGQPVSPIINK